MPVIDHDQRRGEIANAAVRIIAAEGLDAATVRRIAAEVGCSTTVVTHYFSDKHELLLWTYRSLGAVGYSGREQTVAPDRTDLLAYLMAMTATTESNLAYWRAYIAIWDRSLGDSEILAELRSWTQDVLGRIDGFIRNINPAKKDVRHISKKLLSMVQGISVQIIFDPQSWHTDEVKEALALEIEAIAHEQRT